MTQPVGRPTLYKPEYVKQAKKLCELGATEPELAAFFEVCVDTITEWEKVHPEFSLAIKEGRQKPDDEVVKSLFNRAKGYTHDAVKIMQYEGVPLEVPYTEHYPPDTAACIFWLKNRRPDLWRDRQDVNVGGQGKDNPLRHTFGWQEQSDK